MQRSTLVVAFEGPPGGGKSTAAKAAKIDLSSKGYSVEVVSEDDSSLNDIRELAFELPFGDPVRSVMFYMVIVLQSIRAEKLKKEAKTDIILLDRYVGSAVIFDRMLFRNRQDPKMRNRIKQLYGHAYDDLLKPDITLFFDAYPKTVLARRPEIRTMQDPLLANRIMRGFRKSALKLGWERIDANRSKKNVLALCVSYIERELAKNAAVTAA